MKENIITNIMLIMLGAGIGIIGTLITIHYQNKRWLFSVALEIRTKALQNAYDSFLQTFFHLNELANLGGSTEDQMMINQEMREYLIAINRIDIWVDDKSSDKLREILGIFRKINYEVWKSKGKKPLIKIEDWTKFSETLGIIKWLISKEIKSNKFL